MARHGASGLPCAILRPPPSDVFPRWRNSVKPRSFAAAVAAAVLLVAVGFPARAAVIVVETSADNVTGPLCDIRDAIAAANDDTPVGGCDVGGSGADTIDLTGLDQPIELSLGVLPTIRGDVTITGPGAAALTIDGLDTSQIFVIERGNVWIENLTLAGGMVAEPDRGGCVQILPDASVTMSAVRVTGCAAWDGGGIAIEEGSLNLAGSLVDANTTSGGAGAGILNGNGNLWVTTTTLSGNVANGAAARAAESRRFPRAESWAARRASTPPRSRTTARRRVATSSPLRG